MPTPAAHFTQTSPTILQVVLDTLLAGFGGGALCGMLMCAAGMFFIGTNDKSRWGWRCIKYGAGCYGIELVGFFIFILLRPQ